MCSYTPYKSVISVPTRVSGFTIEEMKKYTEDCSKPIYQVALLFQQGVGEVIVLTT